MKINFSSILKLYSRMALCLVSLTILTTLISTNQAEAQSKSLIRQTPTQSSGYLVLNKPSNQITHFEVTIENVIPDANNTFSKVIVQKFDLWDNLFTSIPLDYYTSVPATGYYAIHVIGLDDSNNVIDDVYVPCLCDECVELPFEVFNCYGPDYGYSITEYLSNGQKVQNLGDVGSDYDLSRMWISGLEYQSLSLDESQGWVPLPNDDQNCLSHIRPDGGSFVPSNSFFIQDQSVAYAKLKDKGPWLGLSLTSTPGDVALSQSLEMAIEELNENGNWPSGFEELYCASIEPFEDVSTEEASGGSPEDDVNIWDYLIEEWHQQHEETGEETDDSGLSGIENIWDKLQHISDDFQKETSTPLNLFENLHFVTINRYNENGFQNIITLGQSAFNSEDQTRSIPTFVMTEGLYDMYFVFNDGITRQYTWEVKEKFVNSLELSSLVSAVAFPNPTFNDNINLALSSSAKLDFEVVILDQNGNQYFNNEIRVGRDHDQTHKIAFEQEVPKGVFFCKLIFTDQSEKTITLIKQ